MNMTGFKKTLVVRCLLKLAFLQIFGKKKTCYSKKRCFFNWIILTLHFHLQSFCENNPTIGFPLHYRLRTRICRRWKCSMSNARFTDWEGWMQNKVVSTVVNVQWGKRWKVFYLRFPQYWPTKVFFSSPPTLVLQWEKHSPNFFNGAFAPSLQWCRRPCLELTKSKC